MYEAASVGARSTPSRLALTVAESGYQGLVIRSSVDRDLDLPAVREFADIDVVEGQTVSGEERGGLRSAIGAARDSVPVLMLAGGSVGRNRLAVETPDVDILTRPMRGDGDFNHVMATAAAENAVTVELDLGPVLRKTGGRRVGHIRALRKLKELLTDAGADHVVTAGASSHLEIRAPRELAAVGEAVGLGAEYVSAGLKNWAEIAARNRRRLADDWIAPGISAGPYESEPAEGDGA